MDRDEAIAKIKAALKKRSGKPWSVTGGRGTAWGWITIDAPPKRRTWHRIQNKSHVPPAPDAVYCGAVCITPEHYLSDGTVTSYETDPFAREAVEQGREVFFVWEVNDPTKEYGHMSPAERKELATLLGLHHAHHQGVSVAASSDHRREYVDRAEGRTPSVIGQQYWD